MNNSIFKVMPYFFFWLLVNISVNIKPPLARMSTLLWLAGIMLTKGASEMLMTER